MSTLLEQDRQRVEQHDVSRVYFRVFSMTDPGTYYAEPNPRMRITSGSAGSFDRYRLPMSPISGVSIPEHSYIPTALLASRFNNKTFPDAQFSLLEHTYAADGNVTTSKLVPQQRFELHCFGNMMGRIRLGGNVYFYQLTCFDDDCSKAQGFKLQKCKDVVIRGHNLEVDREDKSKDLFVHGQDLGVDGGDNSGFLHVHVLGTNNPLNPKPSVNQWQAVFVLGGSDHGPLIQDGVRILNGFLGSNPTIPLWKAVPKPFCTK